MGYIELFIQCLYEKQQLYAKRIYQQEFHLPWKLCHENIYANTYRKATTEHLSILNSCIYCFYFVYLCQKLYIQSVLVCVFLNTIKELKINTHTCTHAHMHMSIQWMCLHITNKCASRQNRNTQLNLTPYCCIVFIGMNGSELS